MTEIEDDKLNKSEKNFLKDNLIVSWFLYVICDDKKAMKEAKEDVVEPWEIEYQKSIYDPWEYKFGTYVL
jgi:hypothetical protein